MNKVNKLLVGAFGLTMMSLASDTLAAQCSINQSIDSEGNAPLSWNSGDNTANAKVSNRSNVCSNIPAGSYIESVRISYNYSSNPNNNIITTLPHGNYGLTVSAQGLSRRVSTNVSTQEVTHASEGTVNTFNGLDLSQVAFGVVGQVTNSNGVSCRDRPNKRGECDHYMFATYSLSIEYSEPSFVPDPVATVHATVNGNDVNISWASSANATSYNRQVSINGGSWQNNHTYSSTSVTFFNQQPRSYRYRVQACNVDGCSGWTESNQITVPVLAPSWASASVDGRDVTISWATVQFATSYQREVSIDGGAWVNNHTYTTTSVVFPNQLPRTYRYRARACASSCSPWTYTNTVTVQ